MKKFYFLLIAVMLIPSAGAQNINFQDPDFKNALLTVPTCAYDSTNANMVVDADSDGEISQTEALAVYRINIQFNTAIDDLTGIEYFTNIDNLFVTNTSCTTLPALTLTNLVNVHLEDNAITALDFTNAMQLETVTCQNNQLTTLLMPQAQTIWKLTCQNNQLTTLAVNFFGQPVAPSHFDANNNQLTQVTLRGRFYTIDLTNNQLTTLDLSRCSWDFSVEYWGNPLTAVNFKSGSEVFSSWNTYIPFSGLPNLQYICVNDDEVDIVQDYLIQEGQADNIEVNSYCTFQPGGTYHNLSGTVRFDTDGDGCNTQDSVIAGCKVTLTDMDNGSTHDYYSDNAGHYSVDVVGTSYMFSANVEHPEYFNLSLPFDFVDIFDQDVVYDICVSGTEPHHNTTVTIIPINQVQPGFDANYRILYRNIGNQIESGTVEFNFDDALTDFISASLSPQSQSVGNLSWNFTDLQPLETRTIDLILTVNTPTATPPVDLGTILTSSANIAIASDEELDNNTATIQQTAVNSLDPNDKTCLEGATITPEMAGKYVHYLIRFENNGTANATNVVVKDMIDAEKYDIASLIPLDSSHPCQTRVGGDKLEFFFENINLPFDDANNDGYVLFKIKTKPTLVLGDTFSNTASIYFDYNLPIVTEPAVTTIALLKTQDFAFADYFAVYPNPVAKTLNIQSKREMKLSAVQIYNTLGQSVLTVSNPEQLKAIDVSQLRSGNYFLRATSDQGDATVRFIKK